jgi:hypothetical protein
VSEERNSGEHIKEWFKSAPLAFRVAVAVLAVAGPGGWIYSRFATISYVDDALLDHDQRPLKPVTGLPPHPPYFDAISECQSKTKLLEDRVTELERLSVEFGRWRVGFAAADAERDARRRAESAQTAREAYATAVRYWPCPENRMSCVDPETAAQQALRSPRPPR